MTPSDIFRAGLRGQNPGIVQLLGLCPLLAVTTSLASGLGLGLATLVVLTASNVAVTLIARVLPDEVRIAVFVLLIAALVTGVELTLAAWLPPLHAALGIFLPLIVTNCLLLVRADTFASRQPVRLALLDGLAMGGGFMLVLVTLGALREFLGRGSIGADLQVLLGVPLRGVHFFGEQHSWQFALSAPGAFILFGLLLAARQAIAAKRPAAALTASSGDAPAAEVHA